MRVVGVLVFIFVIFLTGCTSAIKLRAADGRVAECGGSWMLGVHAYSSVERDRACVNDYQRQGFERVP
jgi:hypothetical protein